MMKSPFDLTGRTVLVTGASRGIGRSICTVLAQLGADIIAASRDKAALAETAAEVVSLGRKALAIQTDVSKREQVEGMIKTTVDTFGKIDILVNNAGGVSSSQMVPALEMSDEIWDQVVGVNLKGTFMCCQTAARVMVKQKKGNIIIISSISGIQPYPMSIAYGASKAAVNNLTQSLAVILGPYNIRVNAVLPGSILAGVGLDMSKNQPELMEQRKNAIPLGRIGTPEDVSWAVAYLASDASDYVSGQLLGVDGAIPKSPGLATRRS